MMFISKRAWQCFYIPCSAVEYLESTWLIIHAKNLTFGCSNLLNWMGATCRAGDTHPQKAAALIFVSLAWFLLCSNVIETEHRKFTKKKQTPVYGRILSTQCCQYFYF